MQERACGDAHYTHSGFSHNVTEIPPCLDTTPPSCLTALGSLESQAVTRQDSWSASGNCLSSHRGNAQAPNYARSYSFTLEVAAEVTIDLSSSADTYLYLLSGARH